MTPYKSLDLTAQATPIIMIKTMYDSFVNAEKIESISIIVKLNEYIVTAYTDSGKSYEIAAFNSKKEANNYLTLLIEKITDRVFMQLWKEK